MNKATTEKGVPYEWEYVHDFMGCGYTVVEYLDREGNRCVRTGSGNHSSIAEQCITWSAAPTVITEEDRRTIRYFVQEKGDITRWSEWDEKKDAIFATWPQLRVALHNLDVAERNLDMIVEGIANLEL